MSDINDLKERRKLWLEALSGKWKHSIFQQLSTLAWNVNCYRIINEARRYAEKDQDGNLKLNGMLHNLLNSTFMECTLLGIRRLTDHYNLKSTYDSRDVYSLVSILNDMSKYSTLMTRKNFFEIEDIEYDAKILKIKLNECEGEKIRNGKFGWSVPREIDPEISEERHSELDKFFSVDIDNRSEDDSINNDFFEKIIRPIDSKVKNIKNIVDKRIAHASTPESEAQIIINDFSIEDIVETIIFLMRVHNYIQHYVLNNGTTRFEFLVTSIEEHIEYIDYPLITSENVSALEKKWEEVQKDFLRGMDIDVIDFSN